MVESPNIPATEFSLASVFHAVLSWAPSSLYQVPPLAFTFLPGTTPYPTAGNGTTLAALKAAGVNWVAQASEGGLTNSMCLWGTTMDGRQFNYWYAVDYAQIGFDLVISNAIINGSNNTTNPLYYNQNGIDRLKAVVQQFVNNGISYGLFLGPATVSAIAFYAYTTANPNDYKTGTYNGLSVTLTPQNGFLSITFYLTVTDFVSGS